MTEIEEILRRHAGREGALLPILNDIQAAFGHVPDAAVPIVAEALNLSRAEVHGVVTFYHDLKRVAGGPAGGQIVPRRGLPGARRRRGSRRSSRATPRIAGRDRLLPRPVRERPLGDGRRAGLRPARRGRGAAPDRRRRRHEDLRPRRCRRRRGRRRRGGGGGRRAASIRNGSRGMFELEPLARDRDAGGPGRLSRGSPPATCRDADASAPDHPNCVGLVEDLPFLKRQTRLTFARCGITDPQSIDDYRAHGGFKGLERAHRARPGGHGRGGVRLGPARARRRRLSGRDQVAHRRRRAGARRNISSAMPTRATAAPSPTGW